MQLSNFKLQSWCSFRKFKKSGFTNMKFNFMQRQFVCTQHLYIFAINKLTISTKCQHKIHSTYFHGIMYTHNTLYRKQKIIISEGAKHGYVFYVLGTTSKYARTQTHSLVNNKKIIHNNCMLQWLNSDRICYVTDMNDPHIADQLCCRHRSKIAHYKCIRECI